MKYYCIKQHDQHKEILLFLGDVALNSNSFENMELSDTLVGDGHVPAT